MEDGNSKYYVCSCLFVIFCYSFGLFSITFMYFRALVMIKREKESWGGKADAIGGKVSTNITEERKRMILQQRNVDNRQVLLQKAVQKAKQGGERRSVIAIIYGLAELQKEDSQKSLSPSRRLRDQQEKEEMAQALYEKVNMKDCKSLPQRSPLGSLKRKSLKHCYQGLLCLASKPFPNL